MGAPTFNSTEKFLTFNIYYCILRIRPKKVCYLTKANFHQQINMMNLQYFSIFMYIWWLLKFVGGCGKLTKSCRHARTFQLVSQRSLASINNKNSKILTKWPPGATTGPSGTRRHHWGIGVPRYTFGSSIQARAIPQPSWVSALPVTTGSL